MTGRREIIAELYRQVGAPDWAAPNLDGLADVLRDLSWLPDGPVTIELPDLLDVPPSEREMMLRVLTGAVAESIGSTHPLRVIGAGSGDD